MFHGAFLKNISRLTLLAFILNATLPFFMPAAANAAFGWWWADPTAALLVAATAADEARENWGEASAIG